MKNPLSHSAPRDNVDSYKIQNVLFLTSDPIGPRMAGPGIRSVYLALALEAHGFNVQVATTGSLEPIDLIKAKKIDKKDEKSFTVLESWADAIVFQALAFEEFPNLRKSPKYLVADAYAPVVLENLARLVNQPGANSDFAISEATRIQRQQIMYSDLLICANENQRNFYLGALSALKPFESKKYAQHPNMQNRIAVIPFGLSRTLPEHRHSVVKGVIPGISRQDKLVLWSGGLYEWFDIENLIRAFSIISTSNASVKLLFLGASHPNSDIPEMPVVSRAKTLAAELGLLGVNVFFNESWVDFDQRENYLLEADLGITTHFDTLETTFSFRTRMLDYLWAGLPVVSTEGDVFANQIRTLNLGEVAPFESPEYIADSILRLISDKNLYSEAKTNVLNLRKEYYWDLVVLPLVNVLREVDSRSRRRVKTYVVLPIIKNKFFIRLSRMYWQSKEIIKNEGFPALVGKVWLKIVR